MTIILPNSMQNLRVMSVFGIISALILLLASSNNPPNGSTGAPGEGLCTNCHSGNNPINGSISLLGMPSQIVPGTDYDLTVTLTRTAGTPLRGGFQLVALNGNNANTGSFSQPGANVAFESGGGKTYAEHRPFKLFSGNDEVSFDFKWTAPAVIPGNQVTFYFSGVLANGNGGSSGDRGVNANFSATVQAAGNDPEVNFVNIVNVNCSGGNDGSITAQASQGVSPYAYSWSNGAQTPTISNLTAGTYTVTVTDANNATTSASVTLTQPTPLLVNLINVGTVTCAEPQADIEIGVSGGVPAYAYSWSDGQFSNPITVQTGGTYTVTVSDSNGCTTTFQVNVQEDTQSPLINGGPNKQIACFGGSVVLDGNGPSGGGFSIQWSTINGNIVSGANTYTPTVNAPGDYLLTVVNQNNGCLSQDVVVVSGVGSPITVQLNPQHVTCFGGNDGQVNSTVAGGTAPYSYLWSNGQSTNNLLAVPAGSYTLTITDANLCTLSAQVSITQPTAIEIDISTTAETGPGAADGTATANASGGAGTFIYTWSTGATTQQISDLSPGSYRVTVVDTNGCSETAVAVVNAYSCAIIPVIVELRDLLCYEDASGFVEVSAVNAFGSISAVWSNGANENAIQNVAAGLYTVTITDEANCSGILEVELSQPDAIVISLDIVQMSADGADDGSIMAMAEGGTGALSFTWSNGSFDESISNLPPGYYVLTVSDENNCIAVVNARILPINCELEGSFELMEPISCFGASDAVLRIKAASANEPITVFWMDGDQNTVRDQLAPGTYSAILIDEKTCEVEISIVIEEPALLELTTEEFTAQINSEGTGIIEVAVSGGTAPYRYVWTYDGNLFGDTPRLEALNSGTYTLELFDSRDCSITETFEIGLSTSVSLVGNQNSNWLVFPNPATELIVLRSIGDIEGSTKVRILNQQGVQIFENIHTSLRLMDINVDLSSIIAGNYILLIESGISVEVFKISKL
jgi:hypothetical protein